MMATKNPFQGDDVDPFSAVRDESGAIKRETGINSTSKPAAKTAAKAPIVTKEQMQKAGFDNLRDYLNAQRGLTRRGEKPAAKSAPADTRRVGPTRERAADMPPMVRRPDASTSRGVRAADTSTPKAKPAEPRKPLAKSEGYQRQIDRDEAAREQRQAAARQRQIESKAAKKESDKASAQRLRDDPKQKELRAAREAREKMSPAERSAARGQRVKEFFGAPKKMAKGGSVRGSGIARQGVRKAKMM